MDSGVEVQAGMARGLQQLDQMMQDPAYQAQLQQAYQQVMQNPQVGMDRFSDGQGKDTFFKKSFKGYPIYKKANKEELTFGNHNDYVP